MLYLVTALFEEAVPFIKKYNLKYQPDFPHFDLFTGGEALLLVTRPGALRAAAALSSVLTAFPPKEQDLLLSVGLAGCAAKDRIGQAFLLARITEGASGRTRYPELLYRCPFPEAEVITQAAVCRKGTETKSPSDGSTSRDGSGAGNAGIADPLPLLYDMEAAGIYEAAIPYFSCDRLLFIKVVSDALTGLEELSRTEQRAWVTGCMARILPELGEWLDGIHSFLSEKQAGEIARSERQPCTGQRRSLRQEPAPSLPPGVHRLGADGGELFSRICTALRLSAASSYQLYQLMLYLTLSKIPYMDSMRELLAVPLATPCRVKKEGLKYLEQLNEHYL